MYGTRGTSTRTKYVRNTVYAVYLDAQVGSGGNHSYRAAQPPHSALSALKTKKKGEEKGGKRKERREEEKTAVESAVERGVRTRTARRTHATHTPLTAHRTKQSLADRTMGKACIRAK